ncbi:MAG: tetratricopeptide repeat protein [Candidatus Eisenbacteria bacterium]
MGHRRFLAVLFVAALLPRLLFLSEATGSPLFTHPYLDAKSYDEWGMEIASGKWVRGEPFHMAPLYPYLLGAFYRVAGHNLLLLRLIQHLVGAASMVLVYLVAHRLFGRAVATVAYLLALGYGSFIYYEGQVLASFLGILFGLLGLYLLVISLERGGRGLFLAGLVLGIGAVARPNLLFFIPLAFLWILCAEKSSRRRLPLYIAGCAVALIPSTVHNYSASRTLIPISSHGGVSFYLGNNPYTRGVYVPPPEFGGTPEAIDIYDSRRLAERDLGRPLGAAEISSYWYGRSFAFIRENPGRFLALLARKIALYFNAFEVPLDVNYEFDRRLFGVLRWAPFSFGILLPLALAGAFLIPAEKRRGRLLVLFVLANAASVVAFFVCARYRQTAVPAIAILGAVALVRLAREGRASRWRPFAVIAAPVALLAILVHIDVYEGRATSEVRSTVILGRAHAEAGDREGAERLFRDALRLAPGHVDASMNLGLLYYQTGRYREAADAFTAATEGAPGFAGAWNNLGNALREGGELGAALEAIRAATFADTSYAGAFNNLGYTLALAGREDEAEEAYRRAIRLDPGSVHARANLADLQFRRGKMDEAVETMNEAARVLRAVPAAGWKREQIARGADLSRAAREAAARGDSVEAVRALGEALALQGAPVREWAERDPVARPILERTLAHEEAGGRDERR